MGNRHRTDSQEGTPPTSSNGTAVEVTATERAILTTLCRPYVVGQSFPSPASDTRILGELAIDGISLDREGLRAHLHTLYVKFGIEEELRPRDKRVRLVECVYDHGVISGWSDTAVDHRARSGERRTPSGLHFMVTRVIGFMRDQPHVAAQLGAVVVSLSLLALASALGLWGL
jgi:hypothetical protein